MSTRSTSFRRRSLAVALSATVAAGLAVVPAQAQSSEPQGTLYTTPNASSNLSTETSSDGPYQTFVAVAGQLILVAGLIAAGVGLYNAGVAAGILPPVLPAQ